MASSLARLPLRRAALRLACTTRTYHAPVRDMKFQLYEVHGFEKHYAELATEQTCDRETVDMVIEASAQLCENDLHPLWEASDKDGCTHVDEYTIKTPKGFKEAYDLFAESGWQGLAYPEKYGGQGLPQSLSAIQSEMIAAANWTWLMFPGLSKGCINTIVAHGSEELKDKYLEPLVTGQYTGTMCLTEPQCGSDLGQVSTKAVPCDDGTYKVSGTKIFISCGDHDLTENIIHCVLARLPGAPEGTKGISLFLVPKRVVDEEGASGDFNNVKVSRIENKMGCHGSPTCQIEFEEAQGWLIGTENRGLNHMFTFINTSRVGTAVQGVAAAELAFQNSLWYCKDRKSMRALSGTKAPDAVADPIIWHPSVRTMLLTQKAVSEGGRSMVYECTKIADKMAVAEAAGDAKTAKLHDERLAFLTPILKGFLTELGKESADLGVQAYGGHGYIKDNKAEQVYRDVRIAALWEGTTQIQALDLLGRKVMLQKLRPINEHCSELYKQCLPLLVSSNSGLRDRAWKLMTHAAEWQYLTYRIAMRASGNKDEISASSVDYLMFGGYVTLASHWLRMESVAVAALASGSAEEEAGFYTAKVQTSAYVFERLLPRTRAHKAGMLAPLTSLMDMQTDNFSFDHGR
jgi:alkylation response protein AidB-like acyl-CoA dehydrogenase